MATAHHRRSRNKALEDEDATQLRLGEDFDPIRNDPNAMGPLTISEVRVILEGLRDTKGASAGADTPVYKKTVEFVNAFGRFSDNQTVTAVRNLIATHQPKLQPFEQAQIANLCPQTSEEAKSLIPSLMESHRDENDDETLQALLNEIDTIRRFQS